MEAVLRDQLDRVNRRVERLATLGTPASNPVWVEVATARTLDDDEQLLRTLNAELERLTTKSAIEAAFTKGLSQW
jgi:hypothetical protein